MTDKIPLTDVDGPTAAAEDSAEQLELASIHDFGAKLVQPGAREALEHYVRWQVALRGAADANAAELDPDKVPDFAPISINLDLTTACNDSSSLSWSKRMPVLRMSRSTQWSQA